ncbi:1303_t:CDS:2 [Dentiscutata heterogama]|uniref:1303_t:CDS:1 n=1 Tax=Dentiscutata heterogama TaxID=1316150 RepID=A0ACA9LAV8_9GLOM|nr:1303_t:CDS:2 [Dentiscutata heterogama]
MWHTSGPFNVECYQNGFGVEMGERKTEMDAIMMNNEMNVRLRAFLSNLNKICE